MGYGNEGRWYSTTKEGEERHNWKRESHYRTAKCQRMISAAEIEKRLHMKMHQVALGDVKGQEMRAVMGAAAFGTPTEGSFCDKYAWRKLRESHPEEMKPCGQSLTDDLRSQYTMWQHINNCFEYTKSVMIASGLARDEPKLFVGEVGGVWNHLFYLYTLTFSFLSLPEQIAQ